MTEVKWIKILVNIFDDEKIQYIETMPNGDEIIVIWFRIMCLAGKSNNCGLLMMTEKIPYTDEMLSAIFNRDIKSINMALTVFENLDMIEIADNNAIHLLNWEKHQNTDALAKMREVSRNSSKRYREKQKLLSDNTVTSPSHDSSISISNSLYKELNIYKEFCGGNDELYEALIGWEEMRKANKHKVTDRVRKLALTELNKLTFDPKVQTEIVNQSTLNGWKSFYSLKQQQTNQSNINKDSLSKMF